MAKRLGGNDQAGNVLGAKRLVTAPVFMSGCYHFSFFYRSSHDFKMVDEVGGYHTTNIEN